MNNSEGLNSDDLILTNKELEFSVFCIENVAFKLNIKGDKVYRLLTYESNILYGYIVPNYEILHTQSKDYIVDDIIEYMREEGLVK